MTIIGSSSSSMPEIEFDTVAPDGLVLMTPGPAGATGPKGDTGAKGHTGATGAASTVAGPKGDQGIQGVQGVQGAKGDQGIQGPKGDPGDVATTDPRLSDARAPLAHTHVEGDVTGLTAKLATKADLVGGLIPQAQLPAIAVTEFLGAVATQAAMLALVGQRGDWCTRTDRGTDFQLIMEPSSVLAHWRERTYPASPVSSVAGRVGAVTLSTADVSGAVATTDSRLSDSRTPKGTTRASWNAGTADSANLGLTPAELKEAVETHIAATDPKSSIGGISIVLGNDDKLYDARTPTAHTHPASAITATAWHLARTSTAATTSLTSSYRASYVGLIDTTIQSSGATVSALSIGQVEVPVTGWYMLTANIRFGTPPTSAGSYCLIAKSDTSSGTKTEVVMGQQSVAGQSVIAVTTIAYLTAGTFVNPGFFNGSAGTVTGTADGGSTSFRGVLLGV